MAIKAVVLLLLSLFIGLASLIVYAENSKVSIARLSTVHRYNHQGMDTTSFFRRSLISPSPSSEVAPPGSPLAPPSSRVYRATTYGADPTGKTDSTDALLRVISDAFKTSSNRILMQGINDLGGAEVHLEGGSYMISRPLQLPASGGGNLVIHGGSLRASNDFATDRYLIELSATSDGNKALPQYTYEDITLRDLMLDPNYRGGGISVINSLRTSIDNCYITHFATNGILVQGGHETYIHNSFLGQHITAGGDPNEKNFSGIAINLMGNDNAVTDVVIFSGAIGVMVSGQANTLSGVHCYNKATGWGGTGIYLQLPGLTQTRIVNCYMDYTGIVAEDPVQLHISSSFFLGDAFILFKSIKGIMNGVNVVDNMFSGSGKGINIVQLDQSKGAFTAVNQVVIDRNNVQGMTLRATVARGLTQGNGTSWTVDFNPVLLFPNLIRHAQYALSPSTTGTFPNHALRNVSGNRVVVESDIAVPATVYVAVDQGMVTTS
ncbi:hypothetical protein IFM89_004478 [Coptis chinensis]|uniref:Rhamnogalacturonase A/B/Epimerase-like pectate lyase domain-containing protein n=1 Tax=Coptis chinensis TaxID=261450 RepID=A0A835GVN3_9MAGN|nr:hypothetical protein IFM89_004478 [Coptis chinensis]